MSKKVVFIKEKPKEAALDRGDPVCDDSVSLEKRIFLFRVNKPGLRAQTEVFDIPRIGRKSVFFPPADFQHNSSSQLKPRNLNDRCRSELSETRSMGLSSRSAIYHPKVEATQSPQQPVPEPRKSKRRTIADFVYFLLSQKYSCATKTSRFFSKLVLPHIISIALSCFMLWLQDYVNSSCFINSCECGNFLSIRLYTTAKACFIYWNLIIMMGYITIFHIDYLKQFKFLKFLYIFISYLTIFAFYLSVDCSDQEPNFLYFYGMGTVASACFLFVYLVKLKFDFNKFVRVTSTRVNLMLLIFLNFLMNKHGYKLIKSFIELIVPFDSLNVFQLTLAIFIFIFRFLFKRMFYNYAANAGISDRLKLDSIGYFVRVCVCLISATELSNLLELDLSHWGVWVILINHIGFLLIFYTRYNLPLILLNKLMKLLIKKEDFFRESKAEILVDKLLAGYMIDFQFILVPRLLSLMLFRRWLNNHIDEFYQGCNMEISDKFMIRKDMALLVVCLNVLITVFVSVWMYLHNKDFFIYIPEKIHVLKRSYLILMVHNYFEYVLQELRLVYM